MNQAVGIGTRYHALPEAKSCFDALEKKWFVDRFDTAAQKSQRDLRAGTVVRRAKWCAAVVDYAYCRTRLRAAAIDYVGSKNP